jgi:hypothetical protein
MTARPKRCRRCNCLLNDAAYPKESADPRNTGSCQDCRAQRGDMEARFNLGEVSRVAYDRYLAQLREKVRG